MSVKMSLLMKIKTFAIARREFLRVAIISAMAGLSGLSSLNAAEAQIVFDLNPSKDNPRNSEGAFVSLKSGRILFLYTRFHGGSADASPANIVSIFSDDAGRTWSNEPKVI